jgi:predicted flap endonuclease-1-like 5' DNA nuclease
MKTVYTFIALFFVWCLIASVWYMFWVKGLSSATENINPHESAIAIAEILLITLISVLIGFAIAWYMREDYLNQKQNDVKALVTERKNILNNLHTQKELVKKNEHTLTRARETFHDDYIQISRERDRMREELVSLQTKFSTLKDEFTILQIQLGNERQKVTELNTTVQDQQQQAAQKEKENSGVRYFINPYQIAASIEKNDIDDLKEIKGIGPVIEKKLNMLGIVNFKQISEFNSDAIDQIAHTLKFFPDRISRDNWVQQARELSKSKSK